MIVNPNMIVLARESRGMTQKELADELNVSQGMMSKLEQGNLQTNQEVLSSLGKVLQYPESFFYQKGDVIPINLNYRKKSSIPVQLLKRQSSYMNIVRLMIERITAEGSIPLRRIKPIIVTPEVTPAHIAKEVRKLLEVPRGPISNLVEVIEASGIVVVGIELDTEKIDGRSILTDDGMPIIFYNTTLPADRQRFTIAHELGHIVMHVYGFPDESVKIEDEANDFASEFLMPEEDIYEDLLVKLNFQSLGALKKKWKVSMASLIYRAKSLGIMSDNSHRFFMMNFAKMGFRKREPQIFDIAFERTNLYEGMLKEYSKRNGVEIKNLPMILNIETTEFFNRYSGKIKI